MSRRLRGCLLRTRRRHRSDERLSTSWLPYRCDPKVHVSVFSRISYGRAVHLNLRNGMLHSLLQCILDIGLYPERYEDSLPLHSATDPRVFRVVRVPLFRSWLPLLQMPIVNHSICTNALTTLLRPPKLTPEPLPNPNNLNQAETPVRIHIHRMVIRRF